MTNGEKKGIVVELIDGLHPNGAGYQSMAGLWDNALP
jgi:lysophospholipase L1-like esterase